MLIQVVIFFLDSIKIIVTNTSFLSELAKRLPLLLDSHPLFLLVSASATLGISSTSSIWYEHWRRPWWCHFDGIHLIGPLPWRCHFLPVTIKKARFHLAVQLISLFLLSRFSDEDCRNYYMIWQSREFACNAHVPPELEVQCLVFLEWPTLKCRDNRNVSGQVSMRQLDMFL